MGGYGKWIGGGVGWALGGPIGALIGFLFGSMFDSMQSGEFEYGKTIPAGKQPKISASDDSATLQTQAGDFNLSLLVLIAAVMKSDQRVLRSELDYVKKFLLRTYGEITASQLVLLLRDLLKKEYDVVPMAQQIRQFMDYSARLQLLHHLFGIAGADGTFHTAELAEIEHIAHHLGIKDSDFRSIKAMFIDDLDRYYKILDISPEASDEDVKKAYRRLALLYHPDRVAHLGPDIQQAAKIKFQELNNAYQAIKNQRGFS